MPLMAVTGIVEVVDSVPDLGAGLLVKEREVVEEIAPEPKKPVAPLVALGEIALEAP